jgi:hypothetical protein
MRGDVVSRHYVVDSITGSRTEHCSEPAAFLHLVDRIVGRDDDCAGRYAVEPEQREPASASTRVREAV